MRHNDRVSFVNICKNANLDYFAVRSKAISYTAFSLIKRNQSVKRLNRSSPVRKLPLSHSFLGLRRLVRQCEGCIMKTQRSN